MANYTRSAYTSICSRSRRMVLRTVMDEPVLQAHRLQSGGAATRVQCSACNLRKLARHGFGIKNCALERVGAASLHLLARLALPDAHCLALHRVLRGNKHTRWQCRTKHSQLCLAE